MTALSILCKSMWHNMGCVNLLAPSMEHNKNLPTEQKMQSGLKRFPDLACLLYSMHDSLFLLACCGTMTNSVQEGHDDQGPSHWRMVEADTVFLQLGIV
jgi:hypothetical protein